MQNLRKIIEATFENRAILTVHTATVEITQAR